MSRSAKPSERQEPPRTYPRHNWVRPASETALTEASGAFQRAGFADATLVLRWAEIVGPAVARLARPMKWQEGESGATLTLKCEAGAAVLLQHQTRELIHRLNAYLGPGRIARVKIVPGQISQAPEPPDHPGRISALMPNSKQAKELARQTNRLAKLRNGLIK
jgi:hypothetical protein